jgi:hypothetical protein
MGCVCDYAPLSTGGLRVVESCRSFFLVFSSARFFTGPPTESNLAERERFTISL